MVVWYEKELNKRFVAKAAHLTSQLFQKPQISHGGVFRADVLVGPRRWHDAVENKPCYIS